MTTLTRITLSFIGGILLGQSPLSISPLYLWQIGLVLLLIASCFFFLRYHRTTTLLSLFSFLLLGLLFHRLASQVERDILPFRSKAAVQITGTIIRDPVVSQRKTILVLDPEEVVASEDTPPLKGLLQVTIRYPRDSFHYGERIRLLSRLSTPKGPGREGDFDYRAYLARQGIYWLMRLNGDEKIERLGTGRVNPIMALAISLKERIVWIIKNVLPYPSDLVLEGIMLGRSSQLPPEIEEWFKDTGVSHILAASGLNVAFVVFISLGIFKVLRIPLKWSMFLSLFLVYLYALITGAEPSILRASIMATTVLTAYLIDREINIYHSLALAALAILIINPLTLFDIGFQLSFGATLGIVAMGPPLTSYLKRFLWDWLAASLAVSISAQLALWPILAYYFNQFSLIGVLANLVIVPLSGLGMGLGFAVCLVGLIKIDLARIVGLITHLLLVGLVDSAHLFSLIPHSSIYMPRPSIPFILGYYLVLVGLKFCRSQSILKFLSVKSLRKATSGS